MNKKVLLIGAGPMAVDYAKVLKSLNVPITVVGNSEKSAAEFKTAIGTDVITGGLDKFLEINKESYDKVIVSISEQLLGKATLSLIKAGYKNILLEKPGGNSYDDIKNVSDEAKKNNSDVYIGYNRRFFSSVMKAQEIIKEDGGVTSFYFEFTEWGHVVSTLVKGEGVLEEWFMHNSTHIVDLAFYLGGKPKELSAYSAGGTSWHPSASVFTGAGKTEEGALFSYNANWEAPGRWVIEILTKKHRLIFKPVEKLQIQKIGSVAVDFVEVDDKLDTEFKPGLYLQTKNYLEDNYNGLLTIHSQLANTENYYMKIAGKK